VVDAKYFKGTHRDIHNTGATKTLMRFCLNLIFFVPFVVVPMVTADYVNRVFLKILLFYAFPPFWVSFYMFGFSKKVNQRLRLVQEEQIDLYYINSGLLHTCGDETVR